MVKRFFIEQTTGRVFILSDGSDIWQFFREAEEKLVFDGMFGTGLFVCFVGDVVVTVQYVERKPVWWNKCVFRDFGYYKSDDIACYEVEVERYVKSYAEYGWEELTID